MNDCMIVWYKNYSVKIVFQDMSEIEFKKLLKDFKLPLNF